jgi:hypothetical protein
MDAMEFFQLSAGKWRSQRTTHHLAFRRSESGESNIQVEALAAGHQEVIDLCQFHQIDPTLALCGSFVSWHGSMAWDRDGEDNHEGSTVFVLVPDDNQPRQGKLLRERGYAEIVPVVGHYHMDDEDGLVLTTEYETMSSVERFWFASPNLRLRTSTVKRFGGFSTASLCTETRIEAEPESNLDVASSLDVTPKQAQDVLKARQFYSIFGW